MALLEVFADLAQTTVAASKTAPAGGTVESWTVASSASFPAVNTGTVFYVRDPANAAELIAVTAVSGTTWTVTRGANSTTPVTHGGGFTVIQTASAGALNRYREWQFPVEASGAVGDGKVLGDVVTNTTTTITSATAAFTSADVGKHIMIHGAGGTTAGPLITTIASVTNSTTAVLTAAATASVSNCPAVYGTDDTAAIAAAVSAAGTYALANDYFAEVLFGSKIYILATGPTQTGNGTTTPTFNAQVPLPFPAANGTSRKLVIALTGAGDAGYCQYFGSVVPNVAGSALVSMVTAPSTPSATFGIQSVIAGPSGEAGFTRVGGNTAYANVKAVVKGLSVWLPIWTNVYAWDLGYVTAMRVQQCSAHIFAPPGFNGGVQPYLSNISSTTFMNSIGTGFRTPVTGNNDAVYAEDSVAEGYECAFRAFDHFTFRGLRAIYSDVVMFFDGSQGASGTSHNIVGDISAEAYNGGLLTNGGTLQVDLTWDAEIASPSYDVSDSNNALHGIIRFRDPANTRFPTVSGAANLKVICEELGPGPWSGAPSAPATTVAQQNTAWRDATVTLSNTTAAITSISVGPASGSTTVTNLVTTTALPVAIRVPAGHWFKCTYASGTLVTKWFLD